MSTNRTFSTRSRSTNTPATTTNNAGGAAIDRSPNGLLAQIAATNCFNGTYYVSADDNLKIAKEAAIDVATTDPQFVAQVAVYSRQNAFMKDMPAFLTVVLLEAGEHELFHKVFDRVIDNGKMLRNVIQIARSGVLGKKRNVGSGAFRKAVQRWFNRRSGNAIFRASVGNDPSMRDILRMCHVYPQDDNGQTDETKGALFAYLTDAEFDKIEGVLRTYYVTDGQRRTLREHRFEELPPIVQAYENYKQNHEGDVPAVDFRMLDSLGLGKSEWTQIALNGGWQMVRMNLATFARHGVFEDNDVTRQIADKLRDTEAIKNARVFPYQLMMAYKMTSANDKVPHQVREALQDAMEIAISNVPTIDGQIYIAVDTSGSMGSPITGDRGLGYRANSSVRCIDAAALFASAIMRRNHSAQILPFDYDVHTNARFNPRDTVLTNADKLARMWGGGTNCSSVLNHLNSTQAKGDAVIYVSDYESWVDRSMVRNNSTSMLSAWDTFQRRNPRAKLICIDLTPGTTSQTEARHNILQVGGFSDQVFDVVKSFMSHGHETDHWISRIQKTEI